MSLLSESEVMLQLLSVSVIREALQSGRFGLF